MRKKKPMEQGADREADAANGSKSNDPAEAAPAQNDPIVLGEKKKGVDDDDEPKQSTGAKILAWMRAWFSPSPSTMQKEGAGASHRLRKQHVSAQFREFIIFVPFLYIVTRLAFSIIDARAYYFTSVLSSVFVFSPIDVHTMQTFQDVNAYRDFWMYMERSLVRNLYWQFDIHRHLTDEEIGYIYYNNKLLGLPRVRQLAVKNGSCTVDKRLRPVIESCFNSYEKSSAEMGTILPDSKDRKANPWLYFTQDQLKGSSYTGVVSTYDGGGYIQDLATTYDDSLELITFLRNSPNWLSVRTRAIFVDFTVYNIEIQYFCAVRLLFELPATGGIITSSHFDTIDLNHWMSMDDGKKVLYYTGFFLLDTILQLALSGPEAYVLSLWNLVDWIIIVLGGVTYFTLSLYHKTAVKDLDAVLRNPPIFRDLHPLIALKRSYEYCLVALFFVSYVKVFKYIRYSKLTSQLVNTLARATTDLFGYIIMFAVFIVAFSALGLIMFGGNMLEFRSLENSLFTTTCSLFGKFPYNILTDLFPESGQMFFLFFVITVFLVYFNVFLAIVNTSYMQVKLAASTQPHFHFTDLVQSWFPCFYDRIAYETNSFFLSVKDEMISAGQPRHLVDRVLREQRLMLNGHPTKKTAKIIYEELRLLKIKMESEINRTSDLQRAMAGLQGRFKRLADYVGINVNKFISTVDMSATKQRRHLSKLVDLIVEYEKSEVRSRRTKGMVKEELIRLHLEEEEANPRPARKRRARRPL